MLHMVKCSKCLFTEVTNQPITSQRLKEKGGTQLSENGPKKRTDPASSSCVEGNTMEMSGVIGHWADRWGISGKQQKLK